MRLKVRGKLLATSGALLLAALAIAAVSIVSLATVNAQADRAYAEGTAAVDELGSLNVALADKTGFGRKISELADLRRGRESGDCDEPVVDLGDGAPAANPREERMRIVGVGQSRGIEPDTLHRHTVDG